MNTTSRIRPAREIQDTSLRHPAVSFPQDDLGAPEASATPVQDASEESEDPQSSEDTSNAQASSEDEGEDKVPAETHQLAMGMLQTFNELGDDAAFSDYDDAEEGEQAEEVEAAAAYLCKRLKQGSLVGMEDTDEDDGDDWPYDQLPDGTWR